MMSDYPMGWVDDKDTVDAMKSEMVNPFFSAAAPMIKGSGKGKIELLHLNFNKLGIPFPLRFQKIGDCVSMGHALAVDTLKVTEIVNGDREEWVAPTSTEDIYSGSRVIIGGNRLRDDGSIGAWACKYMRDYGTLLRKKYSFADLTTYSGSRAREWGSKKLWPELYTEAKLHSVMEYTAVESYNDVIDSIYNGYPVTICSNQGFISTRDKDGFARASGTWNHCYHPNSWVYGPKITKLSDCSSGSFIYDQNGNIGEVESVTKRQYKGDLYTLRCSNGEHKVTADHVFLVKTAGSELITRPYLPFKSGKNFQNEKVLISTLTLPKEKENSLIFVKAKDLQKTDQLITPRFKLSKTGIIPDYEYTPKSKKQLPKLTPNSDLAWLFGLYTGDGCSVKNHKISIIFNKDDKDQVTRAVKVIKDNFGLTAYIYDRPDAHATNVVAYNATLANFMKKWFNMKDNKQFPEWLINESWDLMSLIKGFCDADGTYIKRVRTGDFMQMSNTSQKVIHQIYMILNALGYTPSMWVSKTHSGSYKTNYYNYFVSFNPDKCPKNEFNTVMIKEITKEEYDGEVVSLETSDTHSYVCNGSVSHNCMMLIAFDDTYSRPGCLCVNSWGPSWISGSKRHEQPEGSFWMDADIVERIVRQGDSWAISGFNGFRPKPNARII